MHALVTVHDVMPHTLEGVNKIVTLLQPYPHDKLCLLVVPGLDWKDEQLDMLRQWQSTGFELAGHGWHHESKVIKTFYHRLHSLVLSRNCAEHLSLDNQQLKHMITENYSWFGHHDFSIPQFYVPPAWAMGHIKKSELSDLPFRYYESLGGILDSKSGKFINLPLIGFEADTRSRKQILRVWNSINKKISSSKHPVRISIHPYDLDYYLGDTISDWLEKVTEFRDYRSLFET